MNAAGIEATLIAMMKAERKNTALKMIRRTLGSILQDRCKEALKEWRNAKEETSFWSREELFKEAITYLQAIHDDEIAKLESIHVENLRERSVFLQEASTRLLESENETVWNFHKGKNSMAVALEEVFRSALAYITNQRPAY